MTGQELIGWIRAIQIAFLLEFQATLIFPGLYISETIQAGQASPVTSDAVSHL